VTLLVTSPFILVVYPGLAANSVKELIALARAKPGTLNYGSAGVASSLHMTGELFKHVTKINIVHVAYKGTAPALTDLLGGKVDVLFASLPSSIEYIKAGKLRELAITSEKRSEALPDLPTIGEFVPGYEMSAWFGVGVPKGTPVEIIDKINKEITRPSPIPR